MLSNELQQLARCAKLIYDQKLRSALEPTHRDDFVAVEPISGEYFLGRTMRTALSTAERAYPDRLFHVMRIGHEAAIHVGST